MLSTKNLSTSRVPAAVLSCFLFVCNQQTCGAQGTTPPNTPTKSLDNQANATSSDDRWHVDSNSYFWLPGVRGTLSVLGRTVGIHASAIDLAKNARLGIMHSYDFSYNRFVIPVDIFFVRLKADKSLPFPGLMATTATATVNELILTPKIGYRLIDTRTGIKVTAVTGVRYWHVGESLGFSPNPLNLNISRSQNWADPLVGANIHVPLTPKIVADIQGDVGGWGAGSQLEYQIVGLLGYKKQVNLTLFRHKLPTDWTFQAGYRYLYVNWQNTTGRGPLRSNNILDLVTSGVVLGTTVVLK